MTNQEKHLISIKKKEQKIESGKISDRFPNVSSITIHVTNYHGKKNPVIVKRVLQFSPDSYAYFILDCLRKKCVDGGFDFNKIITKMTKGHRSSEAGELVCKGNSLSKDHSYIVYKVTVRYGK